MYANRLPIGVAFGVLTCLLINHFGLTSRPRRQRWIEVLSRPIATKTKSNWCVASGGQCKQSRCINRGISLSAAKGHAVAAAHTFTGKYEQVNAMSLSSAGVCIL